jgi:hypothetical protein
MFNLVDEVRANNPVLPFNATILNSGRDVDKTSEKYKESDSLGVVNALNELGWGINSYKQVKAHNEAKQAYKAFKATFINSTFPEIPGVGKLTALYSDARDGTKSEEFRLGFYTFICTNGLIVGNDLFQPIRIRHSGSVREQVVNFLDRLDPVSKDVYARVDAMRVKTLSKDEQVHFAQQAAVLRFGSADVIKPEQLLQARRTGDNTTSLFHTFNRIQENIIKPEKLVTYSFTNKEGKTKERKARGITNISLDNRINTELWTLAESYLQ